MSSSDIVERLRDGSELAMSVFELQAERFEAADELERKDAELERLRLECERAWHEVDLVTKNMERLRAESTAFEQAWKNACVRAEQTAEELATAKALLREAMDAIDFLEVDVRLVDRIRSALGDEP